MRDRFSVSIITVAIAAAAVGAVASVSVTRAAGAVGVAENAMGRARSAGHLDGSDRHALPTPSRYANQEFFTEAQRAELDKVRSQLHGQRQSQHRGTELDVAGAYNNAFGGMKHTGPRTSLIVDPPNGRLPAFTPEAQKIAAADREFRLALMRATRDMQEQLTRPVPAANTIRHRPSLGSLSFRALYNADSPPQSRR